MRTALRAFTRGFTSICLAILLVDSYLSPATNQNSVKAATPQALTGTFTLWYSYVTGGAEETALNLVLTLIQALNPGLSITATQVEFGTLHDVYTTAVQSGGGPDLLLSTNDWLGDLARDGVIANINEALAGKLTSFETTTVEGMKYEGNLYGIPESAKAVALFYNKSSVLTPPATTADLLALVSGGKKLVIFDGDAGGAYYNFGFFGAFGGQLMDAAGRCIADQGGFREAMEYLVALKNAGAAVIGNQWNDGIVKFRDGQIDFLIDGPWNLKYFQDALGANAGLVVLPAGPSSAALPLNGIDGFFVNPNSLHIPEAVQVALLITSQENSQIFTNVGGHIPVRTDVFSTDPLINTFKLTSATGLPRPQGLALTNYWMPFGNMMTDVLSGTVNPSIGVRQACEEMNTLNGFLPFHVFLPIVKR